MKRVIWLCAALMLAATGAEAQTLTLTQLAQKVKPSIAKVISTVPDGESIGTAFMVQVIKGDTGRLLTNCHVVKGASKVEVQFLNYELQGIMPPPSPMEAKVLGCDELSDLAVIECSPPVYALFNMPPVLGFANPRNITVGESVATIGFAMNLGGDPSVHDGTINGVGRTLDGKFSGLIQTNATINHGNSGGPLMDMHGNVAGVNTYTSPPNGSHNIFYARSVETALPFAEQIIAYGGVLRADYGLNEVKNVSLDSHSSIYTGGVKILSFTPGSPLEKAGMRVGDTIVRILPCPNFEKYNHDIGIGCKAGIEGKNIPDIGTLANVLGTDLRPKMYAIFYVTRVNPGCDDPKNKTSIECMLNDQQQFTAKAN